MNLLGSLGYKITAETNELKSKLKEAKSAMKDTDKAMKQSSGEIADGLSSVHPAAGMATQGIKQMSAASKALAAVFSPIGLAIAAVAVAIGALTAYFKNSVEGQQKFAEIMAFIGGVADTLKDAFINLGGWIVKAFTEPQEAVKQLWEVIKTNFINRFKGMVDMVTAGWEVISQGAKGVGLSIAGIFDKSKREAAKLAFAEMQEGMVDFAKATVMAVTGIEDIGGKLAALGDKAKGRARENMALQTRENALRMQSIKDSTVLANLEADIAALRLKAHDDTISVTEAISAQAEAMKLIEEKYKIQERQGKEALAIQHERMALGHNAIEDLEKEAELQNALIGLAKARDGEARSLLRRYGTLINQQEAEEKARLDGIQAVKDANEAAIAEELQARGDVMEHIRQSGLTEVDMAKERMAEMLAAHAWNEEEKATISKYWLDQIVELEKEKLTSLQEAFMAFADQVKAAGVDASGSLEDFGKTVLKIAKKNIAVYLAEAVAGAVKNALTSVPFPFNLIAAGVAGGAAAAIFNSAVPKLAMGGVIPPGYPNDTYPAMLSSGETVIPPRKLDQMMGGIQGEVVFRIEGDILMGILDKQTKKHNLY